MSSLQEKLYNHEQVPPPNAWEGIAAALDESHIDDEFPSALYDAEAAPPAQAWNKIAAALEPEPVSVVPMRQKNSSFFRYAAAAVLVGVIIFGVIKWMNGNSDKTDKDFATAKPADKPIENTTQPNSTTDPGKPEESRTGEGIASTDSPDQLKPRTIKKARNNYSVADNPVATEAMYAYNEPSPNLADRYIMYMTPDGGIVRMSKKWGSLVCCVSGQEQDPDCKDQLRKWQEKLACAPVGNGNFMDILSLVNTLNTDL